ncbi:STAS domain-containing protein [Streptomyces sp. p1417]|uniref:STAS domain-containing protein n=1 Tax=Streptomyces typhae TaxID=2681492 RepID=A0A6L6WUZ0_9ACTN|nr:STAS domain-containing protein [Streptomyces typhae]MVO85517.1 STAS domain-containing protein [Streptomyces typhae]
MVSDRQSIDVTRQQRVAVVSFRDELDLKDTAEATLALSRALTDTSTAGTLLDLSGLTFADSTQLNVILRAHAEHQDALRPFVLAGPYRSGVARLFEVTGVTDVLDLSDTVEDGIRRVHLLCDTARASAPEDTRH